MTSTDTYQLKWHSHSSHLNGSVASLLRSERFTDVVLCTMDGSQIPAHKFILSSCSVYLSTLFEGQRSVTRMGGMLYVVLPSEISTKALKILVEYMYKGETTVSNEVLDTVLKAGEVLKIRGLWRQTDEAGGDSTPAEKTTTQPANINKQAKKPDEPKITVKKDDKLLKTFNPVQPQGVTRPMFIGPPKLVFIKTSEGSTQAAALRPGAPKGQTILVAPAPTTDTNSVPIPSNSEDSPDDTPPPRILRRHAAERKYGKKQKTDHVEEEKEQEEQDNASASSISETSEDITLRNAQYCKKYRLRKKSSNQGVVKRKSNSENCRQYRQRKKLLAEQLQSKNEVIHTPSTSSLQMTFEPQIITTEKSSQSTQDTSTEIQIKDEPEWDASSIEEEERSIAEMFQAEMSVKSEPIDDMDIEEESLLYSPLACELCAEVFTVPAAWVRHVQRHAHSDHHHPRKRRRSASDDTEETMALLRCDLCQKHFPNPAEWVRHVQGTHTETELAISNNSAPPKRHNRFTDGEQNKICSQCNKTFPSHASMLIHMRTHTGERPFVCGLCNKGFNVKSNLLRHLRTLHDQVISPARVEEEEGTGTSPPLADMKKET